MHCIVLIGPTGGATVRSAGAAQGPGQVRLRCSPTPGKHTATTGTRPQMYCAQRHRSTAHLITYQEHHTKDTRDGEDEEDAWNRMKRMT